MGHVEGPFAPVNIKRKLHEMDEVVRRVYAGLGDTDLLVVLSDHGMANEGGHGGSSYAEITTPAMFISKRPPPSNKQTAAAAAGTRRRYEQVDLVSTLACLLDVDIPSSNTGVTFLAELADSLLDSNNSQPFKCLVQNLDQLLLADSHLVFEEATLDELSRRADAEDDLQLINADLERLLRRAVEDERGSSAAGRNKLQELALVLSLACMLIVSQV